MEFLSSQTRETPELLTSSPISSALDWKASSRSLAGRITLINAVTTAIPTHVMQCTMLPTKVCKEIDKINRKFLWADSTTRRKIHLLNCYSATKPKSLGGLGIKESIHRNKELLAKRLWEIRSNLAGLHVLMLRKKYHFIASPLKRYSSTWTSLCKAKSIYD